MNSSRMWGARPGAPQIVATNHCRKMRWSTSCTPALMQLMPARPRGPAASNSRTGPCLTRGTRQYPPLVPRMACAVSRGCAHPPREGCWCRRRLRSFGASRGDWYNPPLFPSDRFPRQPARFPRYLRFRIDWGDRAEEVLASFDLRMPSASSSELEIMFF
jgi:hypothetical protein